MDRSSTSARTRLNDKEFAKGEQTESGKVQTITLAGDAFGNSEAHISRASSMVGAR